MKYFVIEKSNGIFLDKRKYGEKIFATVYETIQEKYVAIKIDFN